MGLNPNVKYFLRLGLENINHTKMKQKLVKFFKFVAVTAVMLAPTMAFGYNEVQNGIQTSGLSGLFGTGGLTSSQSLPELIANVIRIMLLFAGAIAVVFVIIGGYQYLTSGGNEESAEKGQKTLTNAVIGVIIVVLAYVIINVIVNLVSSNNGFGG